MKLKLLGAVREDIFTLIGCALACCAIARATLLAAPADRRVSPRDTSSSTVEYTERVTNAVTGEVTSRNHSYVAVGTGLNYKDESGQWRESQDLIELTGDGGAAALHGPHKVYFSPNLNTSGAISITSASNRLFRTHILGLYYFDAASGQSAAVALVQDSIGEFLPPNQIVYRDAFNGVKADVRFTYTKAGFESDVILLEKPLPPENYGLGSQSSRLEIWHEFLNPPVPQKKTRILKKQTDPALRQTMVEPDLVDETLDFRDLWFPLGRAFDWVASARFDTNTPAPIRLANPASDTNEVLVAKKWTSIDGRNLLIESVDWVDIAPKLANLPQAGRVASASDLKEPVAKGRQLPVTKVAAKKPQPMRVAAAPYRAKGLVWDYIIVASSGTDYTFDYGTTYHVNSSTYFSGTLTFLSGCIIKFSNYGYLLTYGAIACNGSSTLTSQDDDLYGEKISGSTGSPTYYASPALWLYYLPTGAQVSGMKIRWARTAVQFDPPNDSSSHSFQYSALEQSQTGLYANYSTVSIVSATECGVQTPTYSGDPNAFTGSLSPDCSGDIDSDGDGLLDSWETTYFGNLTSQNGSGDPDGDGLSNLGEFQRGTNPTVADSDGDGLTDGVEVTRGYNPVLFDTNGNGVGDGYEDYDVDGLANLMEGAFGLNPWSFDDVNGGGVADWKEDSDGDGLPDAYERNISGTTFNVVEQPPVLPNPLDRCPIP